MDCLKFYMPLICMVLFSTAAYSEGVKKQSRFSMQKTFSKQTHSFQC